MCGGYVKAFLLAGGLGERLRPLTLSLPKCLVPINGEPLLGIWLDLCAQHGVTDVLLNVSQHPALVREYLRGRQGAPRIELIVEPAPQGTAGTVMANRDFVRDEEDFWILYADTLSDADLSSLRVAHTRHDGVVTLGLFRAPVPTAVGIVDLALDGRVVAFTEKPLAPRSNLANAGICLARPELFDAIPQRPSVDFGHDVFPQLVGRMHGHVIEQFVLDIGSPSALEAAEATWVRRETLECRP
jgi:mannose-1-phosphate guanylyltransferase